MSTKYGAEATKINNKPSEPTDVGSHGGVVRVLYDKYTFTADLSSADIILMNAKLPRGARVIDALLKFGNLDATGGTIDFGWAAGTDGDEVADENGFHEAVDVTSPDCIWASDNAAAPNGIGKKFTEAVQLQIKIEGDTDATSGDVECFVHYVID